jgi:HAD superfamily hydrolase (TIGR01509 family)
MNKITTILFDLGNVLVYIDFGAFWRELGFLRAEEISPFADGYKALTLQYETGNISTKEYLNGLKTGFNNRFAAEEIERAFTAIIQKPVEGICELVKRLSDTYQTAIVSNTNEIHHKIFGRFEAMKYLKKHYLSYQLHVMKPDRGFYDAIIKDQGIQPSKMIFIDDIAENAKAARFAGMYAVKFEGIDHLEMMLSKFGAI